MLQEEDHVLNIFNKIVKFNLFRIRLTLETLFSLRLDKLGYLKNDVKPTRSYFNI